jgi:hypothetical protein
VTENGRIGMWGVGFCTKLPTGSGISQDRGSIDHQRNYGPRSASSDARLGRTRRLTSARPCTACNRNSYRATPRRAQKAHSFLRQDTNGERARRHGPRLRRRPPGQAARVTRDPAAHTQARCGATIACFNDGVEVPERSRFSPKVTAPRPVPIKIGFRCRRVRRAIPRPENPRGARPPEPFPAGPRCGP